MSGVFNTRSGSPFISDRGISAGTGSVRIIIMGKPNTTYILRSSSKNVPRDNVVKNYVTGPNGTSNDIITVKTPTILQMVMTEASTGNIVAKQIALSSLEQVKAQFQFVNTLQAQLGLPPMR